MDQPLIRAATISDLKEVCEKWWKLLDHQGPTGDGAPRNAENEFAAMEFLRKRIIRKLVFMAELDQKNIGIASITAENSPLEGAPVIWNIADVWVDEDWRNMGIGRKLVHHCEQHAIDQGADEVRLTVHPSNDSVVAFYQRIGYTTQLLKLTKRFTNKR